MHDWDSIRRKYGGIVFATSYRILKDYQLASDSVQDVFLEAFRRFQDEHVLNWPALLRWLAVRRAMDRLRSQRTIFGRFESAQLDDFESQPSRPSEQVEFEELVLRVRREIAHLPKRQAEAFWLHCIEQLTTQEVASQLNIDENLTRVLIHRARTRLKLLLADLDPKPK